MKTLLLMALLIGQVSLNAQQTDFISLVFKDKTNFDITTRLENKMPAKYYLLSTTQVWDTERFKIDEDTKSIIVRQQLEKEEHHPYNNVYIFRDESLNTLFPDSVKDYLFLKADNAITRRLDKAPKNVSLISSFKSAKNGFFFSISDPIFTPDNEYAFIDITTYRKDSLTYEFMESYFGMTFLIYKNDKERGWTKFKKMEYLIL